MSEAVDAHCHADLYPDHCALRAEIERAAVRTIAVTTTPKAFAKNVELFGSSPLMHVGLGIHPELATSKQADLTLFHSLIDSTRFIGEIGLDGRPHVYKSLPAQRHVFDSVLALCAGKCKVISLHSPRAVDRVLDGIERFVPEPESIKIMHWFTGTKAQVRRASELGCYFSINHAMIARVEGLDIVRAFPRQRILTETDGPFVQFNGRTSRPADVLCLIRDLADVLDMEGGALKRLLLQNAEPIFQKNS